jgi:hypothetical protein
VPWSSAYYENHLGKIHHYEWVAWSRISIISDNNPEAWLSELWIRSITVDNQTPPEVIR